MAKFFLFLLILNFYFLFIIILSSTTWTAILLSHLFQTNTISSPMSLPASVFGDQSQLSSGMKGLAALKQPHKLVLPTSSEREASLNKDSRHWNGQAHTAIVLKLGNMFFNILAEANSCPPSPSTTTTCCLEAVWPQIDGRSPQ